MHVRPARAKLSAEVTTLHTIARGQYDPQAEAKQAAEVHGLSQLDADPALHRSREGLAEQERQAQAAQAYAQHIIRHGHEILEELTSR